MSQIKAVVQVQQTASDVTTGASMIELSEILKQGPTPEEAERLDANGPSPSLLQDAVQPLYSRLRMTTIIVQLTFVTLLTSVSNGFLTVCIPQMARDLELPQHLIYWPLSVLGLVSGSLLLLAGAVTDVVGPRNLNLTGDFILGCFTLATGLARTGGELIAFRALQGFAIALLLPTSISILTKTIANGKWRNVGIACLGMAQALGFSVGLVGGGVLAQTAGWRLGYYICGAFGLILCVVGFWIIPTDEKNEGSIFQQLRHNIDWVGMGIASTSLALMAYVLASVTASISDIRSAKNIVLLVTSILLIPTFATWAGRQERLHRPALIPNSIWKNRIFTSTCLMVFLVYATMQIMELFSSLFFQQVQKLSALQTSIRFLPSVLLGAALNLTTGLFVDKASAYKLVMIPSIFSAVAPLLMAVINPNWPYWYDAFIAQICIPLSPDIIFTIGLLIISDVFPDRTQGLAGAVFNTVAQFGGAIGLATTAVISTSVTQNSRFVDKTSSPALLEGYRATFWASFAWMIVACLIGACGLRKVGKVGLKRD